MRKWARAIFTGAVLSVAAVSAILVAGFVLRGTPAAAADAADEVTQGALKVTGKPGQRLLEFPLLHTDVEAEIAGLVAKVRVTQEFGNPYGDPIEAVYVFPLPDNAAVNDMVMKIGERTIRADIQTREQARQTYETARAAGQRAALLEQERPNIFTQSVANILPGDKILITITYVQDLRYDHGTYELNFPMVVGPRYIPGGPLPDPPLGGGWAPDTTRVPDASRITPPVLRPEERSGHDIALHVKLDAGVPIQDLRCVSHDVMMERVDDREADIRLNPKDSIPNKDFILRYDVVGEKPESAFLPYHGQEGGYFLLMVQPKADYKPTELTPKEMVFVVDRSGSMSGDPIEKAKEAMRRCVKGMNGNDTFQIIGFSTSATTFAPKPVANTSENVAKAIEYIDAMDGSGGTEMLEGIRAALDYPHDPERMRIVFFMTDGYIGNETEILGAIEEKLGEARLFSFGVGSSVNHYLLDSMAKVGRGTVQYVRPDEETESAVSRFYERIARPYLTDISVEGKGVELLDLYPQRIPDLFSAQPVIVHGRFDKPGKGDVRITGKIAGKPWATSIPVELPGGESGSEALAALWARQKMAELMDSMYQGEKPETVQQITDLALEFRLMSPYTSFVAVEEKVVNEGGVVKTVQVPVPMPEGVSYEGVFGRDEEGYAGGMGGGYGGGGMMGAPSPAMQVQKSIAMPAGAPGRRGAMGAIAAEAEFDGLGGMGGRGGSVASWISVLIDPESASGERPYAGLSTVLTAAASVIQVPNVGAGVETPESMGGKLEEIAPKCLVLPADMPAKRIRDLAGHIQRFVADGRWLVIDSTDPEAVAEALSGQDFRLVDVPADHPVLTGEGTAYEASALPGLRGIELDGELIGFLVPGVLDSVADGVTLSNRPATRLLVNIVSFVLQETAKHAEPAPATEG